MFILSLIIIFVFLIKVVFDIPTYAIILFALGALILFIVFGVMCVKEELKKAENVVHAELLDEIEVYKKSLEYKGFSIGKKEWRRHYEYVDVLDHIDCIYEVEYKDGSSGTIRCAKNGILSSELLKKSD